MPTIKNADMGFWVAPSPQKSLSGNGRLSQSTGAGDGEEVVGVEVVGVEVVGVEVVGVDVVGVGVGVTLQVTWLASRGVSRYECTIV